MNLRLLASVIAAMAVAAPVLHAQDQPAAEHAEHHTELGDHMEKAAKALKKLRHQIGDPSQNASSLELVASARQEFAATLDLKPEKEADLPEDQQAAFQAKFEEHMKRFLTQVDKLSDLLKAGDNAGAAEQLKKLGQAEKSNHKQFKKPHKED